MGLVDEVLSERTGSAGGRLVDEVLSERNPKSTWKDTVRSMVRPTLQGIGAGLGGVAGTLAGSPSGPGAIGTGVAGGALGYAMGGQLADIVLNDRPAPQVTFNKTKLSDLVTEDYRPQWGKDNPRMYNLATGLAGEGVQMVNDLAEGATYEMGGQVAGRVLVPVVKGAVSAAKAVTRPAQTYRAAVDSFSKRGAAKQIEAARTKTGPVAQQAAKNAAETEALKKRMGNGWNVGMGQATEDPGLLTMQRQLNFQNPAAQSAMQEQKLINNQALRTKLNTAIPAKGGVDDVTAKLSKLKKQLEGAATTTRAQAERVADSLATQDSRTAGETLREGANTVRGVLRTKANELYGKVPENLEIDSTPLYRTIQELGDEFDPAFQNLRNTPTSTMNRAAGALEPQPSAILGPDGKPYNAPRMQQDIPERMTFKQVQDFRSQVTTAEREARAAGNFELAQKYGRLREGVDETLTLAEQTGKGEGVDALREANKFYREQYVPTVRQGATGKILAKDKTGAARVEDALVGSQYFKPGQKGVAAAESFSRTFGNDPAARTALRDHAANDLLSYARNPQTGEVVGSKVASWLQRHKEAVRSLGLGDDFATVQNAVKAAEKAKAMEVNFAKTRFGKVLDSDPNQAISYLFGGENSRNTIKTMDDLIAVTKGDPVAQQGLKRSFADMLVSRMETSADDMAGGKMLSVAKGQNLFKQFEPAMRRLYTKQEMQALKDIQRAIEIGNRINKNMTGINNSQTASFSQIAGSAFKNYMPLNRPLAALRVVFKGISSSLDEQINGYVARAMYDPMFAKELSDVARMVKTKGADVARKQLERNVGNAIAAGLLSQQNKQEDDVPAP